MGPRQLSRRSRACKPPPASLAAPRRLLLAATAEAFGTAQTPPILPSVAKSDEMVTMFGV